MESLSLNLGLNGVVSLFKEKVLQAFTVHQKKIVAIALAAFASLAALYVITRVCFKKKVVKLSEEEPAKLLSDEKKENNISILNSKDENAKFLNQIITSGNISELFTYLSSHGESIEKLDLLNLNVLNDSELQKIIEYCPQLKELHLEAAEITVNGIHFLKRSSFIASSFFKKIYTWRCCFRDSTSTLGFTEIRFK